MFGSGSVQRPHEFTLSALGLLSRRFLAFACFPVYRSGVPISALGIPARRWFECGLELPMWSFGVLVGIESGSCTRVQIWIP